MDIKIEMISPEELKGGVVPGQAFDFGKAFSDRMLTMNYTPEGGWQDACIKKFGDFDPHMNAYGYSLYAEYLYNSIKCDMVNIIETSTGPLDVSLDCE